MCSALFQGMHTRRAITYATYPLYGNFDDVTLLTEKDLQDPANVQQTVNYRVDTLSLLFTVGPQVYNLILEYSNIYVEFFSFALVLERQMLHYISVTVIAPKWVTHWIYKYSLHSRRYNGYNGFHGVHRSYGVCCLDFRSMYPSIMGQYNADYDGDDMLTRLDRGKQLTVLSGLHRIRNSPTGSDRAKEMRISDLSLQEFVGLIKSREGSDKVGLNKQMGFSGSSTKKNDTGQHTIQALQRKLNHEKVMHHQQAQDGKVERTHTRHENQRRMRIVKQHQIIGNKTRRPGRGATLLYR